MSLSRQGKCVEFRVNLALIYKAFLDNDNCNRNYICNRADGHSNADQFLADQSYPSNIWL